MTDILNAIVLFSNFVLLPGAAYGAQLALGALGVGQPALDVVRGREGAQRSVELAKPEWPLRDAQDRLADARRAGLAL